MIAKILKVNKITKSKIEDYFDISKSRIQRLTTLKDYGDYSFYKELYEYINNNGQSLFLCPPLMNNDIVLVPSKVAQGAFGVYIKDKFTCILIFKDLDDCYKFLFKEDDRVNFVRKLTTESTIKNVVTPIKTL